MGHHEPLALYLFPGCFWWEPSTVRVSRVQGTKASRAHDFHPVIPPLRSDMGWPKAASACALVLPQAEEAGVTYLDYTDNEYCFEVVQK